MIFRNQRCKTTFLLGAGATRGSLTGISRPVIRSPLNKDFFDVTRRFITCPSGQRYKNCFNRVNKFILDEMMLQGSKQPTMEEVFTTLFMSKDLPEIFRKKRGRIKKEGFRSEIKDFLTLVVAVFRFIQENIKHKENLDHYGIVASKLEEGDAIITLNYDTVVDNALINWGWRPENGYGFDASSKIIYKDIKPHKNKKARKLRNVLLLKPHGSLNWFAMGKIFNLEKTLSSRPISKIEVSTAPRIYNLDRDKYIRFFIPPLYTKFFNNKFWREIWHEVYTKIKTCDCLIIIGCSLITTDYHLHAILSRAVRNRKKPFKKIIIVDRKKEVVDKLKKLFRGRSSSGCKPYKTFTHFIRAVN